MSWRTTIIGVLEATVMGVTAETLFPLTWNQRAAVIGVAFLRALFATLAADGKTVKDVKAQVNNVAKN